MKTFEFNPDAVVVDAGVFPTNPVPLSLLKTCGRVVCCDGAINRYAETGLPLWRIVGDGDSIAPALAERYREILRRYPDQDTNDQTKAVSYLHRKGMTKIAILGATGLREDHTLGNISLLIDYMRRGIESRIYTDYGVFIPCRDTGSFRCPAGLQVSIFNFGATGMSDEGLRYPIRDFQNWWEGTLNETIGECFTIHAVGDYLVFLNYPSSND